ncbi:Type I HSP40 co-chaperone [Coemansia sp. S610]|nr:Type I HSP40 co-chaperone [Coemansia sp. S610]
MRNMTLSSSGRQTFYLYKLLGLTNGATKAAITEAYKRTLVKHHPDNYPGASDIIKLTQHAYEVLGNTETRRIYDMFCQYILYNSDTTSALERHVYVYPKPQWVTQKNDIVYVMDVSLRNMYHGKKTTVVTRDISVEIDLVKGMADGQRITYSGKGLKTPGHAPGDLIVIVNRVDYPFFKQLRSGHLQCEVEVDHKMAQGGGDVCIRHPSGNIISLELLPGEIPSPGHQKILAKMGQASSDKKQAGDLYVKFTIYFPHANVTI